MSIDIKICNDCQCEFVISNETMFLNCDIEPLLCNTCLNKESLKSEHAVSVEKAIESKVCCNQKLTENINNTHNNYAYKYRCEKCKNHFILK